MNFELEDQEKRKSMLAQHIFAAQGSSTSEGDESETRQSRAQQPQSALSEAQLGSAALVINQPASENSSYYQELSDGESRDVQSEDNSDLNNQLILYQELVHQQQFEEELQLQQQENATRLRCSANKENFVMFVIGCGVATYIYFLFEQSLSVFFDAKMSSYCHNVSKWTFALAVLLTILPIYFFVNEAVNRRRYRQTYHQEAFVSFYDNCGSKFLVFSAMLIGSFLSIYLFSDSSYNAPCKVLMNLFQFYLFIFWLCLYLIVRAIIETSPEMLIPDTQSIFNTM